MNIRILTKDNIDEVIENVKSMIIVEDRLIVRGNMTYTYIMNEVLFMQTYDVRNNGQ